VLTAAFWKRMQQRHQDGEVVEVLPYAARDRRMVRAGG